MKENPDIDELLNSFIDGELTDGQRMEVERLIASDESIGRRLRELRKCQVLMGSLPRAEAPAKVLEGVRASLSRGTLLSERPVTSGERAGTRRLLVRRVLAAAAVIGLAVVLTAVIHTILAPDTAPDAIEPGPGLAAASGFSGRLELRTSALVAVDAFIKRAIENNNLSASAVPARPQDKRAYSLECSKEDMNLLLADLGYIWGELDFAMLFVDTEVFGRPEVVNAVTTEQIAEIIDQDSTERRIGLTKDFAALNSIAEHMPGKEIMAAIDGESRSLITIPKPLLTGERKTITKPPGQEQDEKTVRLTIIVNW